MIERYYPASALTDYGTIDWQVIDGRTETIALQRCASEAEALRRARTLNEAYAVFIEGVAALKTEGALTC